MSAGAGPAPGAPQAPRRGLVAKTGWSALAGVFASGAGFLASVAVARLLGPAPAGSVALVGWLAQTSAQVGGLGLPQAATRYLAAGLEGNTPGLLRWMWRWTSASALAGLVLGEAAFAVFFAAGAEPWTHLALGVLVVAQTAASLAMAIAAGRQDFQSIARANGWAGLAVLVSVPAGALAGGAVGAMAGYAAGPLVLVWVLRAALGRLTAGRVDPALRARIRVFAWSGWTAAVVSLVTWSRLELVFLERSWGREGVAMYSVALTTAQLATQPVVLLSGALMAHLSERLAASGPQGAFQSYRAATRLLAALALPLTAWTTVASPRLIPLIFGPAFAGAVPAALATTIVAGVGVVATVGSSLVYSMERARFIAVSGVVAAAAAVAAFAALIPPFGPLGAGVARAAVQLGAVAAGLVFIARWMGAPVPWRGLAATALGSGVAAAAALAALQLPLPPAGALLVSGLVMGASYLLLARWLGVFEAEDRGRLDPALSRLPTVAQGPVRALLGWVAP